jgi:fermentation-respiration switch protein FrsA (DUF1100 family)
MDNAEGASQPRRWRRIASRVLLMLAIAYLGVTGLLMALENWLLFHPTSPSQVWVDPREAQLYPEDLELHSADGIRLHAWWCPSQERSSSGIDAILYLHGNGGNLSFWAKPIANWRRHLGASVLIVDYPGYGYSAGQPSEAGCYAAADAAYAWLTQTQGVSPDKLLLIGESLGGGVAVDLASRVPCGVLVLLCSFTSIPDMAQSIYPWLPARWLVRTQFNNLAKIGQCHTPVFIAHGTADEIVPFVQGKRLFAATGEPRYFLAMEGHGHMLHLDPEFFTTMRQFLASARGSSAK